MRGSVADVVLPARNNPTQYLMQQQQMRDKANLQKEAQALKDNQENVKAFKDLYKIDPGKAWDKFNDTIYNEVTGFRDWVASEQYKGTDARDPNFQKEYYNKLDQVKKTSEKTMYMKEMLDGLTDAVVKDPYRIDNYYIDKFLKATQDEKGNLKHPNDIDPDVLEAIQYDMSGYDASLASKDFVKNSPEELVSWIEQNNSRYGGIVTSREQIKSKLYQIKTEPDGSSTIKTDPQTGLPIINITDEVVDGWKQNPDRALWLQQQMNQADVDAYTNPEQYKAVEKNILQKNLSPYAYAERQAMSASYTQPKVNNDYLGSGLKKENYDNTMSFKKALYDYQAGNLGLLEAHADVGKVVREGNKDFIYGKKDLVLDEAGNVTSGSVIDVIDHSKPDGDINKIYQYIPYKKKPSQVELDKTPPYVQDESSGEPSSNKAFLQRDVTDDKTVNEILTGKGIDKLVSRFYEGKKIKSAEYGSGKLKLRLENGTEVVIPGDDAHKGHIQKILLSLDKGKPTPKPTKSTPAKTTGEVTTPTEPVKMKFDINN